MYGEEWLPAAEDRLDALAFYCFENTFIIIRKWYVIEETLHNSEKCKEGSDILKNAIPHISAFMYLAIYV